MSSLCVIATHSTACHPRPTTNDTEKAEDKDYRDKVHAHYKTHHKDPAGVPPAPKAKAKPKAKGKGKGKADKDTRERPLPAITNETGVQACCPLAGDATATPRTTGGRSVLRAASEQSAVRGRRGRSGKHASRHFAKHG